MGNGEDKTREGKKEREWIRYDNKKEWRSVKKKGYTDGKNGDIKEREKYKDKWRKRQINREKQTGKQGGTEKRKRQSKISSP